MKKAIVTFANNEERYIKAQKRQEESIRAVQWDGRYIPNKTFEDIGSPDHDDVPYAFKAYAIEKARQEGNDIVIWMDSPVYAIKSLDRLVQRTIESGAVFFDNLGYSVGDYTSDYCLDLFKTSREKAFQTPMIMACVMAFDFRDEKTQIIFAEYLECAKQDGYYQGDWNNNNGQVSTDSRVKGHRHDQSVMSIILDKHGVKPLHPHSTFFAYFGNPGHLPHAESVCLLSHGL